MNSTAHPLDPLSAEEFRQVVQVIAAAHEVTDGWRYASIELLEPSKAEVAAFSPGGQIRRTATAVLWNRADGAAYRAVVSLAENTVVSWEPLPGVQPNLTVDEWHECDEFVRRTPELIEALSRRGITD